MIQRYTAQDLHQILQVPSSLLLLDVREPWEFEICHIDPSLNIPMGEIPGRLDELDADQETVLICHHGVRSFQVGLFLKQSGFSRIADLEGGIDGWARYIDKDMATY